MEVRLYSENLVIKESLSKRKSHQQWRGRGRADNALSNNKHLMTGPFGNSEFCFPRISSSRETLRFEGNKIHCSPRDQSLSDLLYSKTKQKQNLKAEIPAITCNSGQQ